MRATAIRSNGFPMRAGRWIACLLGLPAVALALQTGPAMYTVNPAQSHVTISVGKSGVLSFAGHDHEVVAPNLRGRVSADLADLARSSVELEFETAALKVTGKGDPPKDVPEVQRVMTSEQVLDVTRFPTIAFRSRRVSVTGKTPNGAELDVEGDLTLHGVTRPAKVHTSAAFNNGGITARGQLLIKQTDFGMTPVTAAGGTVRTKDAVTVDFVLRADPAR